MSGFDEREKGFERKYENDQELAFKVKARRNHLLGLWAAGKLGLTGDAAEAYAIKIVDPASHLHGDAEIVTAITHDLRAQSLPHEEGPVRLELERCGEEARKQLGVGK